MYNNIVIYFLKVQIVKLNGNRTELFTSTIYWRYILYSHYDCLFVKEELIVLGNIFILKNQI